MKFIFLIVLLANISFFLWEYNSPRLYSAQSNKKQSKQNLKSIFLLNEVVIPTENKETLPVSQLKPTQPEERIAKKSTNKTENASQEKLRLAARLESNIVNALQSEKTATQPESGSPVVIGNTENKERHLSKHQEQFLPPKDTFCYEIGPFQDENAMNGWLALNKNTISHFLQIKKNSPANPRYLVYSPATGSFEQSKKSLVFFQKMGVNDLWVFRKGELAGAISFGLFSKENRALNLQNKLSKKGLETKILQTEITRSLPYLQIFTERERLKSIFNANNKPVIADCKSN